jgi:hypothetical protein
VQCVQVIQVCHFVCCAVTRKALGSENVTNDSMANSFMLMGIFAGLTVAQYGFCNWFQFRAAVIRDSLWINGGFLYFSDSFIAGEGNSFCLNFSSSFNAATSDLTLFASKSLNSTPYIDGMMFANAYELYLYG